MRQGEWEPRERIEKQQQECQWGGEDKSGRGRKIERWRIREKDRMGERWRIKREGRKRWGKNQREKRKAEGENERGR